MMSELHTVFNLNTFYSTIWSQILAMKYTYAGCSSRGFTHFALLAFLLSACSSKNNLTPAPVPSVAPSRSAAAQLLTGLAEQLDALKEQLQEVRNTQPVTVPSSTLPRPAGSSSPSPTASSKPSTASATRQSPCQPGNPDLDQDKLPDSCEDFLADTYAPVIYHSSKESYFPTSVLAFLPQTSLWFSDKECSTTLSAKVLTAPSPVQLIAQTYPASCGGAVPTYSNKTRSKEKQRSFSIKIPLHYPNIRVKIQHFKQSNSKFRKTETTYFKNSIHWK